jgi:hypothetical protein
MRQLRLVAVLVVLGAAWIGGATQGCGGTECPPVECNVEGMPNIADEALACAARAVDGGNGVAYWLMPLSPVVVSETGVVQYVILTANTSEAPVPAMLTNATGEWFFEPEDGAPISIKTLSISVAPNIEAGPNQTEYYVGNVGIWGEGVPQLGEARWANLRLELQDNGRVATLRLRLPIRAERAEGLDADCWRAIMMHRERPVRQWAMDVTSKLLREQSED